MYININKLSNYQYNNMIKVWAKKYSMKDVYRIGKHIGIDWDSKDPKWKQLKMGLSIEMEHDSDPETDVIPNDKNEIYNVAKIAWAHIKELPDYYTKLKKMESSK